MAEREEALNEFEEENCGIERPMDAAVPAGATQEAEDHANVVEVTGTDYEFTYEPPPSRAGPVRVRSIADGPAGS